MFVGFHPSSNELITCKLKKDGGGVEGGSVKKCSQRRIVCQPLTIGTSYQPLQKIILLVDRHFILETPATALPQLTTGKLGHLWFQTIRKTPGKLCFHLIVTAREEVRTYFHVDIPPSVKNTTNKKLRWLPTVF